MKILLNNNTTQETRELGAGPALYWLLKFIPFVGGIIFLVFAIIKKQFKILLSIGVVQIILSISLVILSIVLAFIGLDFMIGILILLYFASSLYMYIMGVINANYWSYNQYIKEGYTVENSDLLEIQKFIEKAQTKQRPFWVLFI